MPTIALVRGVLIMMYFNDHDPPHLHARGPGFHIRIAITDARMLEEMGKVPRSLLRALQDWTAAHRDELMENWRLARVGQPLNRIES